MNHPSNDINLNSSCLVFLEIDLQASPFLLSNIYVQQNNNGAFAVDRIPYMFQQCNNLFVR